MAAINGCLLKNASALTSQNFSTAAVVSWDTNVYDTSGFHTGTDGKITIPVEHNGKYGIFTSCLSLANVNGTIYLRSFMLKNGSASFIGNSGTSRFLANGNGQSANSMWMQFNSPPVLLSTGDYFETQLRTNDGSIDVQAESTWGLYVIENVNVTQRCLTAISADKTTQNYSTPTAIAWDGADVYDTDGAHDPSSSNDSIIIPSSMNGKYGVLFATAEASLGTNNTSSSLAISKNGSLTYAGMGGNSGECGPVNFYLPNAQTQLIKFATGDVFKALCYFQDTSVTLLNSTVTGFGLWVYGGVLNTGRHPGLLLTGAG